MIDFNLDYSDQTHSYYPIVRFALNDGTWVTKKYTVGTLPASFKKGEEVNLIYSPDDPTSFIIINKLEYTDKAFLFIGILLLFFSAYLVLTI